MKYWPEKIIDIRYRYIASRVNKLGAEFHILDNVYLNGIFESNIKSGEAKNCWMFLDLSEASFCVDLVEKI